MPTTVIERSEVLTSRNNENIVELFENRVAGRRFPEAESGVVEFTVKDIRRQHKESESSLNGRESNVFVQKYMHLLIECVSRVYA